MTETGRWQQLARLLRSASEGGEIGPGVAEIAARFLRVEGATVMLVSGDLTTGTFGTGPLATALIDDQLALGEGPSVEAISSDVPVLADDLAAGDVIARMPMFSATARGKGVGAVYAFPLRVGGAMVGVLTGHRSFPGPLGPAEYADGLIVTGLLTLAIIEEQANVTDRHRDDRERGPSVHGDVLDDLLQIASGMLAVQLEIPLVEAHVRIRAHAFAEEKSVCEVARLIVARELRIER